MKHRLVEIIDETQAMLSASSPKALEKETVDFDALISSPSSASSPVTTPSPQSYQRIGTFHGVFLRLLKQDITALDL